MRRKVFFLDSGKGKRFAIASLPDGAPQAGLLYVHPFGEELNLSRRMAALAARAFAERGWLVLQLDLTGCGDSEGDFGDATWDAWIDDIAFGWQWLRSACADRPCAIWTLRAGSLLAADWLERSHEAAHWLMWQPIVSGAQCLTRFLRLKVAYDMLSDAATKTVMSELRARSAAGECVEVAGYMLPPDVARGLAAASLRLPQAYSGSVGILEVVPPERLRPSPATAQLVTRWQQAGISCAVDVVEGPSFWTTQEIEVVPALIPRSAEVLSGFLQP